MTALIYNIPYQIDYAKVRGEPVCVATDTQNHVLRVINAPDPKTAEELIAEAQMELTGALEEVMK